MLQFGRHISDSSPYDYGCCFFNLAASIRSLWCGCSCRPCRRYCECIGIPSDGAIFCSELVTLVYQNIGLIRESVDAENALPMDYFGNDEDDEIDHSALFSACVCFVPDEENEVKTSELKLVNPTIN